jgi:hypothetical protein
MESLIKNWDNSVTYSTINLSISESMLYHVPALSPAFSSRIGHGLTLSLNNFIFEFEKLVINIAENVIAIAAFGVLVIIVILLIKAYKKRKRREEDERY